RFFLGCSECFINKSILCQLILGQDNFKNKKALHVHVRLFVSPIGFEPMTASLEGVNMGFENQLFMCFVFDFV
ncbi:hypothetical protein, partial [Aquimarina algiphila]|uniref:hypothetical protein n=1 Tax=Aquimarina algiphila TaxID=2047982 RepID=UPI00232EEDAF